MASVLFDADSVRDGLVSRLHPTAASRCAGATDDPVARPARGADNEVVAFFGQRLTSGHLRSNAVCDRLNTG